MTQLPDLGRLPLQPTGVVGNANLDVQKFPHCGILKRIKKEYDDALADPDLGLQSTLLTWTDEKLYDDDPNICPFTWTFHMRGGVYKIFVRFPQQYPFKAPYYYIATHGGARVDVKEYLYFVAKSSGGRVMDYVERICATDLNFHASWKVSDKVIDVIKRLNDDRELAPLLAEAPSHYVHRN